MDNITILRVIGIEMRIRCRVPLTHARMITVGVGPRGCVAGGRRLSQKLLEKEIEMSIPYKKLPARVKDKVRKMWKKPSSGKAYSDNLAGAGHGSTATGLNDETVAYKKKPPRKGRPDGS